MKKLAIITPTYNEKDNIPGLLEKVAEVSRKIAPRVNLTIIFIDDNSPDGTAKVINGQIGKFGFEVQLVERQGKLGLGSAYIRGFKEALSQDFDYIVQMDADLSHDPAVIEDMVQRLETDDMVIGSRYIKGGSLPKWSKTRKMISYFGNLYSRIILGFAIHDYTGGFNAYRKEVLEQIDLAKIKSNGYAFQIEMKYKAKSKGFKIAETPIHFLDRTQGKSKFSKSIFFEALINNLKLRLGI